jgi:hypothetical protein
MAPAGGLALYDQAGRGRHGALTSGPTWVGDTLSGFGHALDLDGTDDWVDLGDLKAAAPVTLTMWLYADSNANDRRIFSQASGLTSQGGALGIITGAGDLQCWDGATWELLGSVGMISASTWHHLAVTYASGGVVTAFLNGVQQAKTSTSNFDFNGVSAGLGQKFIGAFGTTFDGRFRDVRLYNRVVEPAVVQQMADRRTRFDLYHQTARKSYWQFQGRAISAAAARDTTFSLSANDGTDLALTASV